MENAMPATRLDRLVMPLSLWRRVINWCVRYDPLRDMQTLWPPGERLTIEVIGIGVMDFIPECYEPIGCMVAVVVAMQTQSCVIVGEMKRSQWRIKRWSPAESKLTLESVA